MKLSLQTAHILFDQQDIWSARVKTYAAKELVELANDWQMEDENSSSEEITEEMFAERIKLDSITVSSNGDFEMFYFDDDMFLGHEIIIKGNINGEFTNAHI